MEPHVLTCNNSVLVVVDTRHDGYVDAGTLNILAKKLAGVAVTV